MSAVATERDTWFEFLTEEQKAYFCDLELEHDWMTRAQRMVLTTLPEEYEKGGMPGPVDHVQFRRVEHMGVTYLRFLPPGFDPETVQDSTWQFISDAGVIGTGPADSQP